VIFRAILHNSQSGDHPQEDLANFKLNMKIIKKKNTHFYIFVLPNVIEICQNFSKFGQIL
jgi:hypothetical protein